MFRLGMIEPGNARVNRVRTEKRVDKKDPFAHSAFIALLFGSLNHINAYHQVSSPFGKNAVCLIVHTI